MQGTSAARALQPVGSSVDEEEVVVHAAAAAAAQMLSISMGELVAGF